MPKPDGPKPPLNPMRDVTSATLRSYSPVLMEGVRFWGWELVLSCGHRVERGAHAKPGQQRGWGRLHHQPAKSDILPAQKRARCEMCGDDPK